jgi:DNA-directed RNA polymerase subunit omega
MKLVEGFDSNYRYVLVAARRARQLQNGAPPVVEPHSRKACRIAEEEINAGKVKWEVPAAGNTRVEVSGDIVTGAVGGESDD